MTIQLSKLKQGDKCRVAEIQGNADTNQFLSNIGLQVGDHISVISKLGSNLIINVKDGRFGIDQGIAKLILVTHD
jgi:ferrous iron transport protein A